MESRAELGPKLAVYQNGKWPSRLLFTLILPSVLLVLAPLAYGLYRWNFDYTHFGPAAVQRWSSIWILISVAGLVLFLLIVIIWLPGNLHSISLHQNGLSLMFPKRKLLCWEQMAGISSEVVSEKFLGIPVRTREHAVLYPAVGKPLQLDGLENLTELVTQIKAHLYPRLFPSLGNGFRSGQWLHFGPVAIQSDAMLIKGRKVPWSQVRSLSIRSGDLVVEFENQDFVRQSAGAIPNLELLFQIIQKITV